MTFKVIPYRQGSAGARELATALQGHVLRLEGGRYRERPGDVIINWGNTNGHPLLHRALNGTAIRSVSNKLEFFRAVHRVSPDIIPQFWERREDIGNTDIGGGHRVVCRTNLSGHSGDGIVIAETREQLVPARLYTKYIPKQEEYRIHVGRLVNDAGQQTTVVISKQQKRRNTEYDNPNWAVRNLEGGFIYARADVRPPRCVIDVARRAFDCFPLAFGAVDVIYNDRRDRAYVLEINSAPGITGTTVDDYVQFFKEF